MKRLLLILCPMVVLMTLSCQRREIYVEGKTALPVIVSIDWRYLGGDPTGTTIYFYPEDGTTPYAFRTNSVSNATVQVPSGYYTVIAFNRTVDEFGTMHFEHMEHLGTASAVLDYKYFAWVDNVGTFPRTVYEPEVIVCGRTDHFEVRERSTEYIDDYYSTRVDGNFVPDTCFVTPRQMVMTATVKVRVHGIQNVSTARGFLSGMAGADYLATRSATDTLATHVIESWSIQRDDTDYTQGYVVGQFRCFGLPDAYKTVKQRLNNHLYLQLMLVDNKTILTAEFDVGHLIEEFANELIVNVVVGDDNPIIAPDVEPVGGSSSGFDVYVEDWGDTEDVVVAM